jgi:DNA-directed RNA polymerase subunit RPC12/RpoP
MEVIMKKTHLFGYFFYTLSRCIFVQAMDTPSQTMLGQETGMQALIAAAQMLEEQDKQAVLEAQNRLSSITPHATPALTKVTKSSSCSTLAEYIVCDQCGGKSIRRQYFKRHMLMHSGKKPYKCPKCPKRFNDSSNRKRHVREMHKRHTRESSQQGNTIIIHISHSADSLMQITCTERNISPMQRTERSYSSSDSSTLSSPRGIEE